MIATARGRVTWAITAAVGLALGATLSGLIVAAAARPLSPLVGGLVYVALYGAIIGGVTGLAQLAAIPRGMARSSRWLAANVVGFSVGYVLVAIVGETLGNVIDPGVNLILGEGTIQEVSGAVFGLAVGIAQWRVLRQLLPRLRWWLIASAVGAALGYASAAAVLELFEVAILKATLVPSYTAIIGLFLGAAQAIVLRSAR